MALDKRNSVDRREFSEMMQVGSAAATASTFGTVKQGVAVANATVAADGTSAGTQLNLLLASLRTAGVIAT